MSKGWGFEFDGELLIYNDECDPFFLRNKDGAEESLKEWLLDISRIYHDKRLKINILIG